MDLRMRLVWRVVALSAVLLAAFVGIVAWSLVEDVDDEVQASSHLAALVMAAGQASAGGGEAALASVRALIDNGSLRHVHASLEPLEGPSAQGEDPERPPAAGPGLISWLAQHVPVSDAARQSHRMVMGSQVLVLKPEPRSEIREIVRDAGHTLVMLLAFCVATVAAAWYAAHRALTPVRDLEGALAMISEGGTAGRMPRFELREFDRIGQAIDTLSASLDRAQSAQHRLTRCLLEVQEFERRELARELHDEIGQSLTAIGVSATFVDRHAERADPAPLRDCARDIREQAQVITRHVRGMLGRLRPYGLEGVGARGALVDLIEGWRQRSGITIRARLPEVLPALSAEQGLALYRTLQEALTNAQRHTRATVVDVSMESAGGVLYLRVVDNGGGQAHEVKGRMGGGLLGMDERARLSGGRLRLFDGGEGLGLELALQLHGAPGRIETTGDAHDSNTARG